MRAEDLDRLEHILEAAERIAIYAAPGEDAFLADAMRQDAIIRNLEIIGEAAGGSRTSCATLTRKSRGRTSLATGTSWSTTTGG